MTQPGFEYEVRLAVSIPIAWATLLKAASASHYDYKCRAAGECGVVNALFNTAQDGEWPSHYPVSWRDLDLVTKVAEQLRHHTDDPALIHSIRAWLRESMAAIAKQREVCMTLPGSVPASDPAPRVRQEDVSVQSKDTKRLAQALRTQVAKFSDRRMDDGDDVWREREIEYRRGIAETANAVCVALQLDATTFAAASGLYVSNGRDTFSDCRPGELTWEKPRDGDAA